MVIRRGATWVCGAMGCSLCKWGSVQLKRVGGTLHERPERQLRSRAGGHKGDSIVGEVGSGCVEEGERDKDRHGGYEIHRPIAS